MICCLFVVLECGKLWPISFGVLQKTTTSATLAALFTRFAEKYRLNKKWFRGSCQAPNVLPFRAKRIAAALFAEDIAESLVAPAICHDENQNCRTARNKMIAVSLRPNIRLDAFYTPESCIGLLGFLDEAFQSIGPPLDSPPLRDLSILFYRHNIESI